MRFEPSRDVAASLSAEESEEIDRLCDRFEAAWRTGQPTPFEDHLGQAVGPFRLALRAELMAVELEWRRRQGDRPLPALADSLVPTQADPAEITGDFWQNGSDQTSQETVKASTSLAPSVDSRDAPTRDFSNETSGTTRPGLVESFIVPGYFVIEELGRGGMGVVYKARQEHLNRIVALKLILGEHQVGSKDLIRFLAEAEAVASIKHPHVVQVHEYGDAGGRPFMAMEYLAGGSLSSLLEQDLRLEPRFAAKLIETLARAIQAAHEQGIVHRDLKPANILFDAQNEPKITDFGLAKRAAGSDITRTHAVMGTPAYMAPEQARGNTKFVGPQADVYSLGVVLYECLAGVRPLDSPDTIDLLLKVSEQEPDPPSKHVPGLSRDLELIVLKCLAKDPSDRYPSAGALADDLARFVAGESISVRATGPLERALKWARRKPAIAAAYGLGAAVLVLLAFGTSLAILWRDADQQRGQAVLARKTAEEARDGENRARAAAEAARDGEKQAREELARVEYGRTMQLAHQQWRENNILAADLLLKKTRPDLRGWEWQYVNQLCHPELLTLQGTKEAVFSVSYSPDGSRIVTGNADNTARIYDSRSGLELLALKGHSDVVFSASSSPDGSRIVTASKDKTARVWDARSGIELLAFKGHTDYVFSASFNPDGSRIVTASRDQSAKVWNAESGAEILTLKGHTKIVQSAAFSPDGLRIVTTSQDKTARVWDAKSGRELLAFEGPIDGFSSVAFSRDGARIITANGDNTARVWDAKSGRELLSLKGHTNTVQSASFSPDDSRIVTASEDQTARVWDAKSGREILSLKGHTDIVQSAAFSPDGSRIITGSSDMTARVWDANTNAEALTIKSQSEGVQAAEFSPDGSQIAVAGDIAQVCDAKSGTVLLQLKGHTVSLNSVSFNSDGSKIVTASDDKTARIWDAKSGIERLTLKGHTDGVWWASFNSDGSRIITTSNDKTARVWDARSGLEILRLKGYSGGVQSAAFSPDGSRIVSGEQETARIWDAKSGDEILRLKGHTDDVFSAAFSPDGLSIITTSYDNTARVWDAKSGTERLTLRGHAKSVYWASFSPDGSRIVTASEDQMAKVWDAKSGTEVLTLKGHENWVNSSCFSPDGSRIVTASQDGMVRIWDCRPIGAR